MLVRQVANALDLLESFARCKRPMTLGEIVRDFGWPRSSAFNILMTLVDKGFLYEPKPRAGYYPTPKFLALAREIAEAEPIPEGLHALVETLAAKTGETSCLAGVAGSSVVFLDVVESEAAIRYFARVGKRIPLHATAAGRALLSQYGEAERRSVLAKAVYERYQPNTLTSAEAVEREIAASLERGWFQSLTEYTPDVVGLAVPLPLGDRRLAITLAGPTFRVEKHLPELAAIVRAAVQDFLKRTERRAP